MNLHEVLRQALQEAFEQVGEEATYHPREGEALKIRVIPSLTEKVLGLGAAHLQVPVSTFKLLAAEVLLPEAGDTLHLQGHTYVLQGSPLREHQGLVWHVEAVAESRGT